MKDIILQLVENSPGKDADIVMIVKCLMFMQVKDITLQLVENSPGKDADIVLGGGLASFLPYYGLYNDSEAARQLIQRTQYITSKYSYGDGDLQ
jgi:hypothetical protein